MWLYHINPIAWTLRGVFGPGTLWLSAAVVDGFGVLLISIYVASLKLLN